MGEPFARWVVAFTVAAISVRIVDSYAPGIGYWLAVVMLLGVFIFRDRGEFRTFMSVALGR